MSARCPVCGEPLDPAFGGCWKCGWEAPLTPAEQEEYADFEAAVEEDERESARALTAHLVELADSTARVTATAHILNPAVERQLRVAQGLTDLREAYRLYRRRHDEAGQPQRPELDRKWTQFLLSGAATVGWAVAVITFPDRVIVRLSAEAFTVITLGLWILTLLTGRRVVGAELRVARAGDRGRVT